MSSIYGEVAIGVLEHPSTSNEETFLIVDQILAVRSSATSTSCEILFKDGEWVRFDMSYHSVLGGLEMLRQRRASEKGATR